MSPWFYTSRDFQLDSTLISIFPSLTLAPPDWYGSGIETAVAIPITALALGLAGCFIAATALMVLADELAAACVADGAGVLPVPPQSEPFLRWGFAGKALVYEDDLVTVYRIAES